jgi:hypothetical protein
MTVLRTVTTLALLPLTGPAEAWIHLPATTLATLPEGTHNPGGIAVDRHGNIDVTTFDITKASDPGDLLVFHRSGSRPAFHPSQD